MTDEAPPPVPDPCATPAGSHSAGRGSPRRADPHGPSTSPACSRRRSRACGTDGFSLPSWRACRRTRSFLYLHAEIAAAAAPQRFGAVPDEPGVPSCVADVIAVTAAAAQLGAAVPRTGVVVRAFRYVDAPNRPVRLQFRRRKARPRAGHIRCRHVPPSRPCIIPEGRRPA